MNMNTQEISTLGSLQLRLLKLGMVLSLAGGICFFLFACGSPKTPDSSAVDSTAMATDSITTSANGSDTTVALDSAKIPADTLHK